MDQRFAGKRILVTGAGGALGGAAARAFAAEGARLFLIDRSDTALEAVAGELGVAVGGSRAADVTDETAVAAAVGQAEGALGGLDIVVNAAGIVGPAGAMIDCALADWQAVFAINVTGSFLVCRHAIPALRRAGGGAVVNYASTAGMTGEDTLGPYAASKAAVVSMTRSLARNHAAEGIRVNCVCPGSIASPMLDNCLSMEAALGSDPAVAQARYLAGHPAGRFGLPDEVAAAVLFLASEEAAFIAGVALPVDGAALA